MLQAQVHIPEGAETGVGLRMKSGFTDALISAAPWAWGFLSDHVKGTLPMGLEETPPTEAEDREGVRLQASRQGSSEGPHLNPRRLLPSPPTRRHTSPSAPERTQIQTQAGWDRSSFPVAGRTGASQADPHGDSRPMQTSAPRSLHGECISLHAQRPLPTLPPIAGFQDGADTKWAKHGTENLPESPVCCDGGWFWRACLSFRSRGEGIVSILLLDTHWLSP